MKCIKIFALAFALIMLPMFVFAEGELAPISAQDIEGGLDIEVIEGQVVWEGLKVGGVQCAELVDQDFERLGEFFMERMMGSEAHVAMNARLSQQLGSLGEEQMHITMGKRMSGCNESAAFVGGGWMPMMGGGLAQGTGRGMMGGIGNPLQGDQDELLKIAESNNRMGILIAAALWVQVGLGVLFFIRSASGAGDRSSAEAAHKKEK